MSNSFDDRHNELYSEWGEKDAYFTFPRWLVEQKKKDEERIQQLESERGVLVEAAKELKSNIEAAALLHLYRSVEQDDNWMNVPVWFVETLLPKEKAS